MKRQPVLFAIGNNLLHRFRGIASGLPIAPIVRSSRNAFAPGYCGFFDLRAFAQSCRLTRA